jgi:hypothetical protein
MIRGTLVVALIATAIDTHSIPGVGDVTIDVAETRVRFALAASDFSLTRTVSRSGGVDLEVGGGGELVGLLVRMGPAQPFTTRRGASTIGGVSNLSALRAFTDGRAVASARERVGEYERQLLRNAGAAADPHAHGFLLAVALLSAMAGDPAATGRARDIITDQASRTLSRRDDVCLPEYARAALPADERRGSCFQSANADDSWHERQGKRLLCDAEYVQAVARAEVEYADCRREPPARRLGRSTIAEARHASLPVASRRDGS